MALGRNPLRGTLHELYHHDVTLLGTGAAAPTLQDGKGITVTRNSEGNYRLSFSDPPGEFAGCTFGFYAATPADVAGHGAVCDTFTAKSGSTDAYIDVVVTDSADAVDDLEANEYLTLTLKFRTIT